MYYNNTVQQSKSQTATCSISVLYKLKTEKHTLKRVQVQNVQSVASSITNRTKRGIIIYNIVRLRLYLKKKKNFLGDVQSCHLPRRHRIVHLIYSSVDDGFLYLLIIQVLYIIYTYYNVYLYVLFYLVSFFSFFRLARAVKI